MKPIIATVFACVMTIAVAFGNDQAADKNASRTKRQKASTVAARLDEMQISIQAQQQTIQQLQQQLQSRDTAIQQLQQQVNQLQTSATQADTSREASVTTVRNEVSELKSNVDSATSSVQETKKLVSSLESPMAIHFKGITLTPGGFIEAAGIYRSHNENGDITSTFGNIPFSGTANSQLSEFRGTARQSRITLLAESQINKWKVSGYYEADFLGAAPTANELESGSFNLRQRQLWGQAESENGLAILAGQSWSLMTTDRKGLAPLKEFIPLTIDSQYVVGYNWARQWGARVTKKFGDRLWAAFAIENPETNLSVINPPVGVFGFNTSPNAQSPNSQFTLSNVPGANGISTDLAPDLIAKVVFEPGWGHYEVKALGRFFRDRIAGNNNVTGGGGGGFGAILPATKKLDVVVEGLFGIGIGRYAGSLGPDVTLRPDGSIVPIRSLQVLAGLELHPTSKWDLYAYGGEEYYGRADYVNLLGKGVGYGSRLADNSGCSVEIPTPTQLCQAQVRNIWQVQPGFWYRFYKGPHGTVQYGMSYSYTFKNTWVGANGLQPSALEHMILSSFRYYLP
jgi:TolA-binding protein